MSQKRKHAEFRNDERDSQQSKKSRPNYKAGGPRNKFKGHQHAQDEASANSISSLKSRVRNLRRLLEHIDNDSKSRMPANVRIERERELEACKHELKAKQAAERETSFRNKIIGKYHHIRFFERQKATRTVKRLSKQLSTTEDEKERDELSKKIHNADIDVNYTIYYPLLKPYVSLFPKSEKTDEPVDGPKGNLEMWKVVETATEEGTLEALRESREGVTIPGMKNGMPESSKGKKAKKDQKSESRHKNKATAPEVDEDDEDSEGGFFE